MNSIADVTQNVAYYASEAHVDLCLLGSLSELTEKELSKLAKDGRLFGFWASIDPPVNSNVPCISKHDLARKIQILSDKNKN